MDTFVNNNQYSFFQYLVITGIKEKTVLPITEIQVQKRSEDIVCYERSSTKKDSWNKFKYFIDLYMISYAF